MFCYTKFVLKPLQRFTKSLILLTMKKMYFNKIIAFISNLIIKVYEYCIKEIL